MINSCPMRGQSTVLDNVELLKKLVYLDLFRESKSLHKTALLLKVTPSAVTQNLKWLEKKLGKAVLKRNGNQTLITAYAETLLQRSRPLLDSLRPPLVAEAQAPFKLSHIELGVYDGLASLLLPEILNKLQKKFPAIKFSAISGRSDELVLQVQKETLCAAFAVEGLDFQGLKSLPIYQDTLGIFTDKNSANTASPAELISKKGIGVLKAAKAGQHTFYSRYLRQLEKISHVSFTSDSIEMLKSIAQEGGMPVVLPRKVAALAGNALSEIQIPQTKKFDGRHWHYLIAPASCDEREFSLLSEILKSIVSEKQLS
jgi:DNA-binding transcriptional LysR family regulator